MANTVKKQDSNNIFKKIKEIHGKNIKVIANNILSLQKKIISAKENITFLTKCKKQNIIPRFIENKCNNFIPKDTKKHLKLFKDLQYNTCQKLLNIHIKIEHSNCFNLSAEFDKKIEQLRKITKDDLFNDFYMYSNNICNKLKTKIKSKHIKKYNNLFTDKNISIQKLLNVDDCIKKWFHNKTSLNIPKDIMYILSLGPKFCLPVTNKEIPICDILKDLEFIIHETDLDNTSKNALRGRLTNILTNSKQTKIDTDPVSRYFISSYNLAKKFLKNNPHLIITKSDKGQKTVLIEKNIYDTEIEQMLSDKITYKPIKTDPTNKIQTDINKKIGTLHKQKVIDNKTKFSLLTYNSTAPKLYCLPKIHKPGNKMRPIVSSQNSPNYKLSKFIANILQPLRMSSVYNIKNSYEFKNLITDQKIANDEIMISLDVISLFTSIPTNLAINIIDKQWKNIKTHTNLNKKQFMDLLKLCINNAYLKFNSKIYLQNNGLQMGGPLSGTIADIILDDLFNKCLDKCKNKIKIAKKFVDDSFLIIKNNNLDEILTIFNNYNKSIKFTLEKEENNQIPFLDILIIKETDGNIKTKHYKKPTASDRMINFYSQQPKSYKINSANNLINRNLTLTSPEYHEEIIKDIKQTLHYNNFPNNTINKLVKHNLDTRNQNTAINSSTVQNNSTNNSPTQENIKYASLPYVKNLSEKIQKTLKKDIPSFRIAMKSNKSNRTFFERHKEKTQKELKSNLVYKIPCSQCPSQYIGETKQYLKKRISQHKTDCKNNKNNTGLADHTYNTGHNFDFDNSQILYNEKNTQKRKFMEMINIVKHKNNVNFKKDVENLSTIYSNLIKMS